MNTTIIIVSIIITLPVAIAILVLLGMMLSKWKTRAEIHELFATADTNASDIVTEDDIADLPEPVQRWLRHSNVVGREKVRTVRLKQKGFFRQGPGQPWMPFTAEQYYTTDPPAFLWHAMVMYAGLPIIDVKDRLQCGHGNIRIKLGALITLANAKAPELDQGVLLRYLDEIMWFPSAAISPYINWSPIDANSAEATISYGDVSASAVFHFDDDGNFVDLTADRYRTVGKEFSLDKWSTPTTEQGEFHGVRIPIKGVGVWNLLEGDLAYVRLEITEIEYNVAHPY